MKINDLFNKKIVFFGDSITDTCKFFHKDSPYGAGYVNMVKAWIDINWPNENIQIFNEGIGGNKTEDLINRIQDDVLNKKPILTFLLIGINDVWHPFENKQPYDIDLIINRIDQIIKTIETNGSKVIYMTPFIFPTTDFFKSLEGVFNPFQDKLYTYLNNKNIEYIDTNSILTSYFEKTLDNPTCDSIHPSIIGHALIAQAIIDKLTK